MSRSGCPRRNSTSWLSWPVITTRCSTGAGSSRRSGATTSTRAPMCSGCTSATCGRSSPSRGRPVPIETIRSVGYRLSRACLTALIARLRRTGFARRLAVAIGAIVVAAAAATFATLYQGTGSRVRDQIERDLSTEADSLDARAYRPRARSRHPHDRSPGTPIDRLRARLRAVLAPDSWSTFRGPGVATNEPELLGLRRGEHIRGVAGRSPREADEAERSATLHSASRPCTSRTQATSCSSSGAFLRRPSRRDDHGRTAAGAGRPTPRTGLARTFLIAGSLTVAVALLARVSQLRRASSAPLRRMATARQRRGRGRPLRPDARGWGAERSSSSPSRSIACSTGWMDAFARQREFVSDASHELRTPLTAIQGQIEVLGRSRFTVSEEEIDATVAEVNREIARLDRLVDDLTLLASSDESIAYRTDLGRPLSRSSPTPLASLARAAGHRSRLGTVPSGRRLMADGDRLAQVLRNLVQNALQHGGPGGVVRVSATARGDRIRMAVDDDGPGIPPAERERVFDRFHRTDLSRTRRVGWQRTRPGDRTGDRPSARGTNLGRNLTARWRTDRVRAPRV